MRADPPQPSPETVVIIAGKCYFSYCPHRERWCVRQGARAMTGSYREYGIRYLFLRKIKILAYHSVVPEEGDDFSVHPETFLAHMEYIKKSRRPVLGLEEAIGLLKKNRSPFNAVVITFDDGCSKLMDHAFPVLERYNFPSTVFVPMALLGRDYRFAAGAEGGGTRIMDLNDTAQVKAHFPGVSFGSHSMTHPDLTKLDAERMRREFHESFNILKTAIGESFLPFAYPFGKFDGSVRDLAVETGYDCALTFGNIMSNTARTDPWALKREMIRRAHPVRRLRIKLSSLYDIPRKLLRLPGKALRL